MHFSADGYVQALQTLKGYPTRAVDFLAGQWLIMILSEIGSSNLTYCCSENTFVVV